MRVNMATVKILTVVLAVSSLAFGVKYKDGDKVYVVELPQIIDKIYLKPFCVL